MNFGEKLKNIAKYSLAIVILIFTVLSLLFSVFQGSYTLTINVDPSDASIIVNNKALSSEGRFEKKMDEGNYNIRVEKPGYVSDTRQIRLNKNITLDIKLNTLLTNTINDSSVIPIDIPPIGGSNHLSTINGYGINKSNGNLVKISGNNLQPIYDGIVRDFDVKNNIAVVINDRNPNNIILINLDTNEQRIISTSGQAPLVSATISSDLNTIYFLGNFDIENKNPSLYSISTSGGDPIKITETRALQVRFIRDGLLALYEKTHAENKNIFHAFSIEGASYVYTQTTNFYGMSPNKTHVYLASSSEIKIFDTTSYRSTNVYVGDIDHAIWKDNNTILVFDNNEAGFNYSAISVNSLNSTAPLLLIEGAYIQNIYGITNGKLYLEDYDGKVYTVDVP